MATKMIRQRMIESIKLLASDGVIQLRCFPDFVCKSDEIASSLNDWLSLYEQGKKHDAKYAFRCDELEAIIELDKDISLLEMSEFSDQAIMNSPEWEKIRKKAKHVLSILKEPYSYPDIHSI